MTERAGRVCVGLTVALALGVVLRLLAREGGFGWVERADVLWLRWDRVVASVSVGASLAIAGSILQALLRNPLASPFILGLTSGAGLGVVLWTYISFLTTGAMLLAGPPVFPALIGAFLALGVVYLLSQRHGSPEPASLILVGVVISILCASVTTFIQHLMPDRGMAIYSRWVMGSISSDTGPITLWAVAGVTLVMGAWSLRLGRALDAASMSDDEARSVGVRLGRLRATGVLIAGVLTAGSVVLAGPIGFIGLIAPHLARRLAGPSHSGALLAAALAGATLVVLADTGVALVRTPAGRMPIGVLTALIGGPLFLWLLRRERVL